MAFKEIVYFVNWHNAIYLKLMNFQFSKSIFYDKNHHALNNLLSWLY